MPHKRNPITGERLSGLARVLRGNAVVALENVALWHERDISHSSAERIILPDSCTLLDYMLVKLRELVEGLQVYPERMQQNLEMSKGLYFSQSVLLALTSAGAERIILPDSCTLLDYMLVKLRELVEGLQVYPERMQQNLELSKGLYFSQSVLLALTRAGAERKSAYEAVQRAAMRTWKGEGSFADNAKDEPEISALLSESEIDALCSLDVHLRYVESTFRSVGLG